MKIFGDDVSPGANYKSVMATKTSTSRELCKMALKRYGVQDKVEKYVLCEVLGKLLPLEGMKEKNKNKKKNKQGLFYYNFHSFTQK